MVSALHACNRKSAFVHRTTIGAYGRSLVEDPYVEADQQGIKVWVTNAKDEGQTPRNQSELAVAAKNKKPKLQFLFPGIWLLDLSPRLKNFIAFVPINAQTTRYYLRVYRRIHTPVVAKLFEWVMALSNRIIINQDKRVALAQTPPDSSGAHHDRLVGADCAISQFRRIHTQMLTKNTIEPTDLMKDDNTLL